MRFENPLELSRVSAGQGDDALAIDVVDPSKFISKQSGIALDIGSI